MSLYEVTAPVGEVCLIPAHSSYGAVSMRRYWSSLISQVREGDPYHFHTIMEPGDARNHPGFMGKAQRYLARRWTYPRLIRKSTSGAIAHVLDHSWADMLPHIPKGVLRVITVHDLFPLTVPGELPAHQVKRFRSTTRHIHSADVITAVSEYTKGELCRELGIDPAVVTGFQSSNPPFPSSFDSAEVTKKVPGALLR